MSKSFRENLTGKRFGRLMVLEFVPNDKPRSYWKCQCDCGGTIIVSQNSLKTGNNISCGCKHIEHARKMKYSHGMRYTRLYNTYMHIKSRCLNPNNKDYKNYGGRGIAICDEWLTDFMNFYDWAMANGYHDDLSIDRIDVNGNYEPDNCRWVDMKMQCRNRRSNAVVEYQGEKMCLAEAAERSGIGFNTLHNRYYKGDRGEKLFRPLKSK